MDWTADKAWSDKFIPHIRAILREPQISALMANFQADIASLEDDQKNNTDIVLVANDIKVSCHVRRPHHFNYAYRRKQFTVRYQRDSGAKTELAKIMEGLGDYMFYGFSNPSENAIRAFRIIGFAQLRVTVEHLIHLNALPKPISNGDGTWFVPFDAIACGAQLYERGYELPNTQLSLNWMDEGLFV